LEQRTLEHMSAHSKLHKMTKTIFRKNYWRLTYCIMENCGFMTYYSSHPPGGDQNALASLFTMCVAHLVLTCC